MRCLPSYIMDTYNIIITRASYIRRERLIAPAWDELMLKVAMPSGRLNE